MSQILDDLQQVADPGPRNSHELRRVALKLKYALDLSEPVKVIEREIERHCHVTNGQDCRVLHGWALRRGRAKQHIAADVANNLDN